MAKETHYYGVTTRFGSYDSFATYEEAKECADNHMKGYLECTKYGSDPNPTIFKIQELESIGWNKPTKTCYIREGGASFGSYRDYDPYHKED